MSYVRIWVHIVFSTKNREPYLSEEVRGQVIGHIMENCKEKGIFLQTINGYLEHIHCLISLKNEQSISNVAQLIKGESSNWINKNRLILGKFAWQDDYFAVSVSESHYKKVTDYIKNQEQHHLKKSFSEETDEFIEKYGWEKKQG